jgi:hypothetical protein
MLTTILTLTQISICLASGPKIVAEVDKISDPYTPLQKQDIYPTVAAFSTATNKPTTITWRWWRITNKPTTITWRWWRITDSVTLKRPTSSTEPPTMTTVTSLTPSGVQNSVISSQSTAVTTTAVTAEQIDTSTQSKSQIHRENMERELKLFKGFNILQIILSGFIG